MKKRLNLPIPVIRTLDKLGKDIGDARRWRADYHETYGWTCWNFAGNHWGNRTR